MNSIVLHVSSGALILATALSPLSSAQTTVVPPLRQQTTVDTRPLPGAHTAKQEIETVPRMPLETAVVLGVFIAVGIGVAVSGASDSNGFVASGGTTGTR